MEEGPPSVYEIKADLTGLDGLLRLLMVLKEFLIRKDIIIKMKSAIRYD